MEDRRPGPEETTDQDNETTPKKRRGGDFLSQYLLRRREQSGEKSEDGEEETEEKPKKFRRFFKGLFKNVVQPPEQSKEDRPTRLGLETLFLTDPENTERTENGSETPELPETSEHAYTSGETTKADEREVSTNKPAEHSEAGSTEEIEASEDTQEYTQPTRNIESPISATPEPEYTVPIDRTLFERSQETPAEKEVIIERGSSMALPVVLVGAEYLARKRADRKLDEKFSTKVEAVEKEAKQSNFSQQELTNLVKQNREQLETLKRERGITPETNVSGVQNTETVQVTEKPPQRELHNQEVAPEEPEKTETYKIMEQVAEAAEHNAPVERVFERSHEVKDDHSTPVGVASIGAIMAAQAEQKRITQLKASQAPMEINDQGLPVINTTSDSDMYKQAMQRGFWGAIIIIVFGLLAYLLK
jgi:hypothetical protein